MGAEKVTICRDFLRNLCKRGEQCKYFHPHKEDGKGVYVFCHDFQNAGCLRLGCKFIHCSAEDEEYYNKTGELLPHVLQVYRKIMDSLDEISPACKDFAHGKCKRGENCKYKHINEPPPPSSSEAVVYEHDKEQKYAPPSVNVMSSAAVVVTDPAAHNYTQRAEEKGACCQASSAPTPMSNEHKRCRHNSVEMDECSTENCDCGGKRRRVLQCGQGQPQPQPQPQLINTTNVCVENGENNRRLRVLENENEMLRQRLTELTKKNGELQATNEFLLEQNARLRVAGSGGGSADKAAAAAAGSLTTVTVPAAVTITSAAGPLQQGHGHPHHPHHHHHHHQQMSVPVPVPVNMQQPPPATAVINHHHHHAHHPHAQMLHTVPVPVSLAAAVAVSGAATPVSIATISMAPMHIPQSVAGTVGVAHVAAPPHQQHKLSAATATLLSEGTAGATATAQIVSYPILSRPTTATIIQSAIPPPPPPPHR